MNNLLFDGILVSQHHSNVTILQFIVVDQPIPCAKVLGLSKWNWHFCLVEYFMYCYAVLQQSDDRECHPCCTEAGELNKSCTRAKFFE